MYVTGFVVKSIKKMATCEIWLNVLEELNSTTDGNYFNLLNGKDCGLIKHSKEVIKTCLLVEKKN